MLFIKYFCLFIIIFSVQTALFPLLSLNEVTPSLILIFAVYCAINFRESRGIMMCMLIGLVQDCLSGGLLGINTLSKSLIAYSLYKVRDKVVVEGAIPVGCFIILASLFDGMIYYFFSILLLKAEVASGILFPYLPMFAIGNILIAPVMFYILKKNQKWFQGNNSSHEFRIS
ncbi:MAG: rod shape-determining protein MreD [Nitrospinales bacterium]